MEQTEKEIDPIKDRINTIRNSKKMRIIALVMMWVFAIIAIVFLIYFIKNVEFIKTNPCGACEKLGHFCTRVLTKK